MKRKFLVTVVQPEGTLNIFVSSDNIRLNEDELREIIKDPDTGGCITMIYRLGSD